MITSRGRHGRVLAAAAAAPSKHWNGMAMASQGKVGGFRGCGCGCGVAWRSPKPPTFTAPKPPKPQSPTRLWLRSGVALAARSCLAGSGSCLWCTLPMARWFLDRLLSSALLHNRQGGLCRCDDLNVAYASEIWWTIVNRYELCARIEIRDLEGCAGVAALNSHACFGWFMIKKKFLYQSSLFLYINLGFRFRV